MCKKLILLSGLVLALCFVGNASAQLPAGWSHQDVGAQDGGTASESAGVWTVKGGGGDIWNTSDSFHYVYQQLPGDGQITARVTSISAGTSTWAKGGVMIRDDLTGPSMHAMTVMTSGGGNGASFQWRPTTSGASSNDDSDAAKSLPYWVRLVKKGNQLSGFYSPDGTTWTQEGTAQTISMTGSNYIGLCVTAHRDDAAGEFRTITFDNVLLELSKLASAPSPANGALYTQGTFVSLGWLPGPTAAKQDVYFGTSYDDVLNGTGGTLVGDDIAATTKWFLLGYQGFPYPQGLEWGETYYWRIDSIESGGTTHKGDVWSFWLPPWKAYNPFPADGSAIVPVDAEIAWTGGYNAGLHFVNISTDYDTVANAALGTGTPIGQASVDPTTLVGALTPNTTYYWRVDEHIPPVTYHKGDVWSFTTSPEGIVGELLFERWLGGIGIDALVSLIRGGSRAPDETGAVTGGFYWDGADTDNYGARISGWVYAPATGDYKFWIVTDDNGRLYLSTDQSPSNVREIARETGWRDLNQFPPSGEEVSAPIPLVAGQRYYIEAMWQEGGGGDHCQVGWSGPGVGADPVTIASQYLSPFDPVEAYGAVPGDGAVDVKQDQVLKWIPGKYATSHDVYFGTDATAVANATKASPQYKGNKLLGVEKYDPGLLQLQTTYYWRIDEVNALHPDSPWTGEIWSFTTGDFLVIDDIEDYNNFTPWRVFETWTDGWGDNSNGSIAGYPEPDFDADETFVERGIVRSGLQSMPFFYENNMKASWITRSLPPHLTNWTQEGVKAISLWYYGYPQSQGAFVQAPAGTYTMTGAGADIWTVDGEEADEFHYAWKQLQGAGSMTVRVGAISGTNLNAWAKAGIMIRETLDPNSAHVFMAATSTEGVALQYRPGATEASVNHHQKADEDTRPIWLRLDRAFDGTFTGYHANDVGGNPDKWTAMNTTNVQMASTVYIGLALTSHTRYVSATATISNITTTGTILGATFSNRDIGIQSNASEPMYVEIKDAQGRSARVYNTDAGAANVTSWTEWGSIGQGIALQEFVDKTPALNLSNMDTITLGFGTPGSSQPGGGGLVFIDDIRLYKPRCFATLAKPALDFSNNCKVDMFDLEILTDNWLNQPAQMTETVWGGAWSNSDIGSTTPAGSFTIDGSNNFTISGAGGDIWAEADAFQMAYQSLNGDGQITARINSIENTNDWAKAGVMIRDSLDAGSAHAMMVITPSNGANMQWREEADGGSGGTGTGPGLTAPICVSLARVGNTFTGYYSTPNGWVQQDSIEIPMTDPVYIGLAVTSHNDGTLCEVTGDTNCEPLILETDANGDGLTDFSDYAILIDAWLDEVLWP